MFISANQVRNVHFVDGGTYRATAKNNAMDDGVAFMINNEMTDMIYRNRVISVTKYTPKPIHQRYEFVITPNLNGNTYWRINLTIPNFYNLGREGARIVTFTGEADTIAKMGEKIKSQLRKYHLDGMFSVVTNPSTIKITEEPRDVNPDALEFNTTFGFDGPAEEYVDATAWKFENGSQVFRDTAFTVTKVNAASGFNGKDIYELYHAAVKAKGNMYGYAGFPYIVDVNKIPIDMGKNYDTLDVVYASNIDTVANPKQRKTITFIAEHVESGSPLDAIMNEVKGAATNTTPPTTGPTVDDGVVD